MFKTDDKLVQACLGISYAILALYGIINFFNPEYIISQYPSLEDNDTNKWFLGWYGMMNFGAVAGIIYMGYKGLERGYFAYAIPLSILFVIWSVMGQMSLPADQQMWSGTVIFSINLIAVLIARFRGLGPLNFDKAESRWGTNDKVCQTILWLALAAQSFFIIAYIINPAQIIQDTPGLEMSDVAQRFAQGIMYFSIAWVLALLYQMRTGYSMALIVTALITSTMFFAVLCNYAVMGQVNGDGNVLLAITIVGNFVGSLILFFRLQSNH
tara:strand:+ start:76 stop:882 length:807 start_codon:yes stop_codon:yes gene_type:complete